MAGSPHLRDIGGPELHPFKHEPPKQEVPLEKSLDEQIQEINKEIDRLEALRRQNWEEIEARPENKGLQELDMRASSPQQQKIETDSLKEIEELKKLKMLLEQKKNLGTPTTETIQ